MSIIKLETRIEAPKELCFDLSRSVEVHVQSTAHTSERAVDGRTSGLCELGDTITWRARHFGVFQYLTVRITQMEPYRHFQDRMVKGAFKEFVHDHFFEQEGSTTIMRDSFDYSAPLGFVGRFAERVFLDHYMRTLLVKRNAVIKRLAEDGGTGTS
ncbi:MAG: cell division protein [Chitinophagaceae bacterium]|nr:MAG: cell division protein [Chitinophagaceae bacterium]